MPREWACANVEALQPPKEQKDIGTGMCTFAPTMTPRDANGLALGGPQQLLEAPGMVAQAASAGGRGNAPASASGG